MAFAVLWTSAVATLAAPDFPALNLGVRSRGEAAIRALGGDLPAVARAYGRSADALRSWLRSDPTLFVDHEGRLLFADDPPPLAPEGIESTPVVSPVPAPLSETFRLHTRPGSRRTIYLDFDGHRISGTAWNYGYNENADIVAPPFDRDGVPLEFNDAERTLIQQVWRRVAEDFAGFDVDVTTELADEALLTRSGSDDEVFGLRVLVSPISSYFGNYGGIAFVGFFDAVGDFYKPALVFPEILQWNEKYIAEACSHEAGHTLGLSHDGTTSGTTYYAGHGSGETGWAPIMGNSYYKNVTQWSRGEYAEANNLEDDLAIIVQNGLDPAADDFGGTPKSAALLPSGPSFSTSGVMGLGGDVDMLAFSTGAGRASISIQSMPLGPNLDLSVDLVDAQGAVVATSAAPEALGADFSLDLPAGTYFLRISGAGAGDPGSTGYSPYASLGYYTVQGRVEDSVGNLPPIAVLAASPASGAAPLWVTFDGTGSTDPDGSVVMYRWRFGDGTADGIGPRVEHSYASAGEYLATLTVTDDRGATAVKSTTVRVAAAPAPRMRVQDIGMSLSTTKAGTVALATVWVTTLSGDPVRGVTVTGGWSGLVNGTTTGVTGADGRAVLTSKRTKKSGTFGFRVTGLSKSGYVYDRTLDVVGSASIESGADR